MGAAAPGRNNLHSLRNRLAANSEFSPRNSGSAFGQAVKNLWHRGIPTLLPNRLSATSGGHWLVHGQTDDHCPMSERILRMHLLPNMQLTSFVESALLTINREGYRRGGADGAVLDVTNGQTFEASSPSGHYFEHGCLIFDEGPSRTRPAVGVLPVIRAKPLLGLSGARAKRRRADNQRRLGFRREGVEDVRADQARQRKSANTRF